ncbi:hypothetical protein MG293_020898 [Ovis ammon polii]|uniref:SRCR domain-containing protein n=1 Tax=Ovis ammon polii TaxID=230172 RepID=A0AAD4Y0E9_OVIAM|nr:hypothetical protein MG293_020898 [Ovis ammon polii]
MDEGPSGGGGCGWAGKLASSLTWVFVQDETLRLDIQDINPIRAAGLEEDIVSYYSEFPKDLCIWLEGNGPCSGRVEVYSGEAWNPVSDGNFTLPTAQVICAELGCGKAVSVQEHELFREFSARVWAEEFRCEGEEPEFWVCPRVPCPGGTCHSGAAQVVCSAYSEVWLMTNGSSQCEGQLGCGVAISTPRGPHYMEEGDQILTARFHCSGAESFLWSCPVTALGGPDCSHGNHSLCDLLRPLIIAVSAGNHIQVLLQCNDFISEPAGSTVSEESVPYCSDSRQLRLVDGEGLCAGREEILDQGSWGTICDDGWDLDDARVVCRQLGCGEALNATGSAHFGAGSGPIWLDELNCTGNESHVWRCPSRGWGRHDCRHKEDAGVICSEFLALRMVSEDQQCAGWLEVFYNGTWDSVYRNPMEDITVSVICRQLGCGDSGTLNSSVGLREGSRPWWVDGIRCQKTDTSLWQCPSDPWNYTSCSPKEEAYISCEDSRQLRLVDGAGPCAGRVEILDQGSWGTICENSWDLDDACVVCRQLGCGEALSAVESAPFGAGSGPIWLDHVYCGRMESHETRLRYFPSAMTLSKPAGSAASEESAPYCSDSRQLRLVDGGGPCAGRAEILDQGSWGTICDDSWDLDDARVVCRQLGCGEALNATGSAHFGAGSGPIWLDDLNCTGKESHVWRKKTQELSSCCPLHREKLQLRGGDSECSGRVEVWHSGSWGTVCDDSWSLAEAEVVCHQLGCGQALEAVQAATFDPGNGSICLDEVRCKDNIAPDYSRYCDPFMVRGEYSDSASSSYEDALAEAVYKELNYLVTQKEGLLGSPEAPDQRTDAPGEDYDDGEEVPVPGALHDSQGSKEEVLPEKEDGMRSQTGSSLNISREEADPGEGEESPCLLQGEKGDPGCDDVELSVPGTSTVLSCDVVLNTR